ncbi:Uncharacterised protein [Bordetella pertussis]|nr:Uncharacterised protein [Bordetella pertussis]
MADRLIFSASSVMDIRPSRCRISRILRSMRSSSRISLPKVRKPAAASGKAGIPE